MKKYIFLFLVISSFGALAQEKIVKSKIKVFGNCSMCKERIETALDVSGIKSASWNSATKELDVVYNKSKISEQKIHEIVASVGHDTELVKAKDSVYADLPFCCLYRESNEVKEDKTQHH